MNAAYILRYRTITHYSFSHFTVAYFKTICCKLAAIKHKISLKGHNLDDPIMYTTFCSLRCCFRSFQTYKPRPDSNELAYDLHFWIGSQSTQVRNNNNVNDNNNNKNTCMPTVLDLRSSTQPTAHFSTMLLCATESRQMLILTARFLIKF